MLIMYILWATLYNSKKCTIWSHIGHKMGEFPLFIDFIGLITSADFNRLLIDLKPVIIDFRISANSQPYKLIPWYICTSLFFKTKLTKAEIRDFLIFHSTDTTVCGSGKEPTVVLGTKSPLVPTYTVPCWLYYSYTLGHTIKHECNMYASLICSG